MFLWYAYIYGARITGLTFISLLDKPAKGCVLCTIRWRDTKNRVDSCLTRDQRLMQLLYLEHEWYDNIINNSNYSSTLCKDLTIIGWINGLTLSCHLATSRVQHLHLGVGMSEGCFIFDFASLQIWRSFGPFSLPCAQKWPYNINHHRSMYSTFSEIVLTWSLIVFNPSSEYIWWMSLRLNTHQSLRNSRMSFQCKRVLNNVMCVIYYVI